MNMAWNGVVPDNAWEELINWFKRTNGDSMMQEKAEKAHQLISMRDKQNPKEGVADYHLRFSKIGLRATTNGAVPDEDKAAMKKLFASYPEDL